MELKLYLNILKKRWWIVVASFLVTLIPTIMFVLQQPWIYESKASFVIRPRSSFAANEEEFVKAIDTLSRRVEINTTFAEVADSSLIKQRALERLELSSQGRKGLKVNGKVKAGTNVLEIVVQGPNPGVVKDFAEAVSLETKSYISGLYDVFELEPLDAAKDPGSPVSPNKPLNIALGGIFGLLMGVSLVFLLEYLQEPIKKDLGFNIVDPETGVYNEPYLRLRLSQELSRSIQDNYSFSLALIKVKERNRLRGVMHPFSADRAALQLSVAIESILRDEDVLAYLGNSTFALLLPNRSGEETQRLLANRRSKMDSISPDIVGTTIRTSIGIITYDESEATGEEILAWATSALEEAGKDRNEQVVLYAAAGSISAGASDEGLTGHANADSPEVDEQIFGSINFRKVSS